MTTCTQHLKLDHIFPVLPYVNKPSKNYLPFYHPFCLLEEEPSQNLILLKALLTSYRLTLRSAVLTKPKPSTLLPFSFPHQFIISYSRVVQSFSSEVCIGYHCFLSWKVNKKATMDVDSQPTMEETILVGDDLMTGPPSPIIPPEISSHMLEGVDLCDGILKNLFLCLQINDIEPFCQDELAMYKQCAERRDRELRKRLLDSEQKLGLSMPLNDAKERATQLEKEVTSLDRRFILASGLEGIEGFRQRWSLHGRLTDTKKRLESLKQGMENRKGE